MTEQEWLICENPGKMLRRLTRSKKNQRKLRLYAVACLRVVWDYLQDPRSRAAVEAADRLADGLVTNSEISQIEEAAFQVNDGKAIENYTEQDYRALAAGAALATGTDGHIGAYAKDAGEMAYLPGDLESRWRIQIQFLRDIFGNPFRPVTLDSAWRTPTVMALAQVIYEERRWEEMPILADALEEVGCDNADVLDHCRSQKEHVRGCWVVDLVLGKG